MTLIVVLALAFALAVCQWWRMTWQSSGLVKGLPLRAYLPRPPADSEPTTVPGTEQPFVVFLTSDSGWVRLNSKLPQALADAGYPTVVWNSLSYYFRQRTPAEAAAHLSQVVERYAAEWGRHRWVVIGYSWGAGTLPFQVNGLPPKQVEDLAGVVYLAYPGAAEFKFHLSAWWGRFRQPLAARDEVARLPKVPSLCIAGERDPTRDCRSIESLGVERRLMSSGHRLGPVLAETLPLVLEVIERGMKRDGPSGRQDPPS